MDMLLPFLILTTFGVFVGTAIFQWLWNITMPEVFDLKEIRYWVAFRLLLIGGFLTAGGFIRFTVGIGN